MLGQAQKISQDNTLYDIPMGSIGSAFVYSNQALLAKAGITAEPTTSAELAADVAKIKQAEPGVTPVTFSGESWWQDEVFFTVADQIDPKLSDELYTGKVAWNSPKMVQALTTYQKLFSSGTLSTGTLSLKEADADDAFNSGKAAFLLEGSWDSSVLSSAYRKANGIDVADVGATYFPVSVAGGSPAARTYAEGGLAIPKSSKHVGAGSEVHPVHDDDAARRVNLGARPGARALADRLHRADLGAHQHSGAERIRDHPADRSTPAVPAAASTRRTSPRTCWTTACSRWPAGRSRRKSEAAKLQSAWTSGRYPLQ